MDKETVKILFESYRPQDADDPMFAEGLREVAEDPELAAWFEEKQRFDALIAQKFREMPVPAEVKARLLADARAGSAHTRNRWRAIPARRRWWAIPLAAAAVLAAALIIWPHLAPVPPGRALALQAISYTQEMPALQFVCFDAASVADWVNEQPRARHLGLRLNQPAKALSMRLIGSSVVDWNGRPVAMICLQDGKHMAMLYIISDADAALPEGASETVEERGWAVRTIKTGGQVRLLTAKGRAQDLDFPMPF